MAAWSELSESTEGDLSRGLGLRGTKTVRPPPLLPSSSGQATLSSGKVLLICKQHLGFRKCGKPDVLSELCLGWAPLELKKLPGVTLVGVLEASSLSEMHNGLHEPDLDGPDEYPDELRFDSEVVLELHDGCRA